LDDFISTTTQLIKNVTDNTTHTAKFILKPESLGTIFVEISLNNNALSLGFKADNMEVMKSIESQLPGLKEKLTQLGLNTEKVDLSYQDSGKQDSGSLPENNKGKQEDRAFKKSFIRSFADSEISAKTNGSESV
jgi:flagellar hook-length control protein FliK